MKHEALEALGCPNCLGALDVESDEPGDIEKGSVLCPRDKLSFPIEDGIPSLVLPDRAARLEALAASYSSTWRKDGWGSTGPEYVLQLPYRDTTRRQGGKWRVKARSMVALFRLLDEMRPRRVVDLGAGICWLSYHLARRGYEVYALDAVRDDVLGLDAARPYLDLGIRFERIWGELDRPPFRPESVDMVICNASFHLTQFPSEVASRVKRILRPGGAFVVMNSPVHSDSRSARRAQDGFRRRLARLGATPELVATYHHFTRQVLAECLRAAVGSPREVPFNPGLLFRLSRRLKGYALTTEFASFPILVSTRQPGRA